MAVSWAQTRVAVNPSSVPHPPVTAEKALNLLQPQFPHLPNGGMSIWFLKPLQGRSEITQGDTSLRG